MPALTPDEWDNVRKLYEGTYGSGFKICHEVPTIGVTRNAIERRAKREGWRKPEGPTPQDRVSARASQKVTGIHAGMSEEEVENRIEVLADERLQLVLKHRNDWAEIDQIRIDALAVYKDPTFKPADAGESWTVTDRLRYANRLFQMFKTASDGLIISQEGARRAYGFDYKMQMKDTEAGDAVNERQEELVAEIMSMMDGFAGGDVIEGTATEIKP